MSTVGLQLFGAVSAASRSDCNFLLDLTGLVRRFSFGLLSDASGGANGNCMSTLAAVTALEEGAFFWSGVRKESIGRIRLILINLK